MLEETTSPASVPAPRARWGSAEPAPCRPPSSALRCPSATSAHPPPRSAHPEALVGRAGYRPPVRPDCLLWQVYRRIRPLVRTLVFHSHFIHLHFPCSLFRCSLQHPNRDGKRSPRGKCHTPHDSKKAVATIQGSSAEVRLRRRVQVPRHPGR